MAKEKNWILVIGAIIIFAVLLKNLELFNRIYIIGDEFGYWANASLWAGKEWDSVASFNPYYSFGYSVALAPLFLIKNPELMYKVAILMNAVFMCFTFCLAYDCAKIMMSNLNRIIAALLAGAAVLYSNNIFSAMTTQCETLLILLYTLIFWLIIKYVQCERNIYMFGAVLVSGYMYAVHMRSLGILVSVAICVVFSFVKRKKWGQLCLAVLLVIGIFIVSGWIKEWLISEIYNSGIASINDFSGQASKLSAFFSMSGIYKFCEGMLCKIFYLGTATFFLFYWFLYYLFRKFSNMILEIKRGAGYSEKDTLFWFMILTVGSTLCISEIALIIPDRLDQLLYGRYNEMLIVPVIIIGMKQLMEEQNKFRVYSVILICHILFSIFVNYIVSNENFELVYGNNMMLLGALALNSNNRYVYDGFVIVVAIKAVFISMLLMFALYVKKRKYMLYASAILLGIIWGHYGLKWTDYTVNAFQTNISDNQLVNELKAICDVEGDTQINAYIYNMEKEPILKITFDYAQYLLPDYKIQMKVIDNINEIDKKHIFIVSRNSELNKLLGNHVKILKKSENFYLMCFE